MTSLVPVHSRTRQAAYLIAGRGLATIHDTNQEHP